MTFPAPIGTPSSGTIDDGAGGNTTTFAVPYPAGVAIGDRLVVFIALDATGARSVTFPAPWVERVDDDGAGGPLVAVAEIVAAASALSGTWTLTISGGERGRYWTSRVGGSHATEAMAVGTPAFGTSTSPNPTAVNPSWPSTEDTLFWAIGAADDGRTTWTAAPASYGSLHNGEEGTSGGASLGHARRDLAADSDDPGAFTIDTSIAWAAVAVAIRPAAAGELHTAEPVATGGGIATVDASSIRSSSNVGTGAGVATVDESTIRSSSNVGTGGGIATVDQSTIRSAEPVATGGGIATVDALRIEVETHTASPVATGGGIATVDASSIRSSSNVGTGAGVATVDASSIRSSSPTATGAGVATVAWSSIRSSSNVATGGGIATVDALRIEVAPPEPPPDLPAGCVVAGVVWDLQGDFGSLPLVLDRDELDNASSVLTPADDAWESVAPMILSASWSWGASSPLGVLTEVGAGRLIVSLLDTTRLFDPLNDESPFVDYLRVGLPIRILADGSPAWTGILTTWTHAIGPSESTLEGTDPIGELGSTDGAAVDLSAGATRDQAATIFAAAGWADRVDFLGGSAHQRAGESLEPGELTAQLQRVRFAELAELTPTRAGGITWRGSAEVHAPDPSITINCGGVFLSELETGLELRRIRNQVVVADHDPSSYQDDRSRRRHGAAAVRSSVDELALT
jgi:hypothetical protein